MNKGITSPTAQRNIDTILAWLDAHNRRDMKAIDCYTDDIEIVEMPTGVVCKGMDKMRELAGMAYRRKGWKELTNIIATETGAQVAMAARLRAQIFFRSLHSRAKMRGGMPRPARIVEW